MHKTYEEKIKKEFSPDFAAYIIDDLAELDDEEILDRLGTPEDFDPCLVQLFCYHERCAAKDTYNATDGALVDGVFHCDGCIAKDRAAAEFEKLIEEVEQAFSDLSWEVFDESFASTGTRYYSIAKGERELKIRVADHGECYCTEDYSVDPDGLSVEDLRRVISK